MTGGLFDIRKGEGRFAVAGFFSLFGILCAHQLLETARDALFLASIPANKLPWMYIVIALFASFIAWVQRLGSSGGTRDCRPLSAWLVVSAGITVGFYFLIENETFLTLSSLYVWTSVMSAVVLVSLWTLAGSAFSTPQARRIFPFLGVGSVLGAIVGTGIARYMTSVFSARSLVLAAAISLLITGLLIVPWLHDKDAVDDKRSESNAADRRASMNRALSTRYARAIVVLAVVGVFCTTMTDFVFKSIVADAVPADELGSFFATTYLVTNSLSLLVQLFVAERMIRRVGLLTTVSALPVALGIGALTVVLGQPVFGALVLIAADGALEHSLYRTALEILYVPFKPSVRRRLKEIIELVMRNGGKAVASFGLLGLLAVDIPIRWIAGVAGLLALVWIVVAYFTRREYVGHYREALRDEIISSGYSLPDLDISSIQTLLVELSEPDEDRALATLRLIRDEGMEHIIPPLILYHPSLRVVDLALEMFVDGDRIEVIDLADSIIKNHESRRLRARVLRARTLIKPDRAVLESIAHDDCEVCRSTATLLLASYGWLEDADAASVVEETLSSGSEIARESVALALGGSPGRFAAQLMRLAEDESDLVSTAAIESMGERQTDVALGQLLDLLSRHRSDLAIRRAIAEYGDGAVDRVSAWLDRGAEDILARRSLLSVLGEIGSPRAAELLQRELSKEDNGVLRYRIVRELESISRRHPRTKFDIELLRGIRQRLVERLGTSNDMSERAHRLVESRTDLGEEWALLVELVDSRDTNHFEVVIRMSALIDPLLDADTILFAIMGGSSAQRDSAREILDASLPASIRDITRVTIDRLFEAELTRNIDNVDDREGLIELLDLFGRHPSGTVRQVAERISRQRARRSDAELTDKPSGREAADNETNHASE